MMRNLGLEKKGFIGLERIEKWNVIVLRSEIGKRD